MALLVYALALVTATHWPRLQLGTENMPAPDKVIHMLAFGTLLVLVWLSGLTGRLWLAGALVAAWAALDEATQALPGLGRTSNWPDVVAGVLGVIVAAAWCGALRPVGGLPNRTRLAWHAHVWEDLFAARRGWFAAGRGAAEGATCALVVVVPALFILGLRRELPNGLVLAAVAGAMIGGASALTVAQRRRAAEISPEQPCFRCGASCRDAAFGAGGAGACPSCGAPVHRGQWIEPPAIEVRRALRARALALAAALAVAFAVAVLMLGLAVLAWRFGPARAAAAKAGLLAGDMQLALHLALAGVGCAAGVRVMRLWEARTHDRQAARCRRCGHDLRGTPVASGVGACGECGAAFARFDG